MGRADRVVQLDVVAADQAAPCPVWAAWIGRPRTLPTPANDCIETASIRQVLVTLTGHIPITSIIGPIGHLLGAMGAVEIAVALLARKHSRCPGTVTLPEHDPEFWDVHPPKAAFKIPFRPDPQLIHWFRWVSGGYTDC